MRNKPHTHTHTRIECMICASVASHIPHSFGMEWSDVASAPDYIVILCYIKLYKSCKEQTGHHVRKIWVIATLITSLWQVEKTAIFYVFTIFVASYILLCRISLYIKSSNQLRRRALQAYCAVAWVEQFSSTFFFLILSVFLPLDMNFSREIVCVRPLYH